MGRDLTKLMQKHLNWINDCYGKDSKVAKIYESGITNTFQTTLIEKSNGNTFVITGDIPAMWLRDSAVQVRPLLFFVHKDKYIDRLIQGVIHQQFEQILIDPYANAFNNGPTGQGFQSDKTEMLPELWERKYETDSLCYPIQLSYLYWKATKNKQVFNKTFLNACQLIIEVFKIEQHHVELSKYRFQRDEDEEDRIMYETLPNNGKGIDVKYTGMTWCGFRPSDDACQGGYLVPSNMFAVVILKYMEEILLKVFNMTEMVNEVRKLYTSIDEGIQKFGIVEHEVFGKVYAYEVDGYGNYVLMDDANVPSLLAIPYFGYCDMKDEIYQNTRKMILSQTNPYYFSGSIAEGIGSAHTPKDYIWPIALAIQGLTTDDEKEKMNLLNMLITMDAGTFLMHEGVHKDNPNQYTRPWFSWANSMFSEFVLSLQSRWIEHSPLDIFFRN